jgi:hypothetical protein
MKFVNKLSVISLIVLMFTFMNVATAAPACKGTKVTSCSKIKDQSQCANNYLPNNDGSGTQCIWDGYCLNGGAACGGKPTITCPPGYSAIDGKCYEDAN